MGKENTHLPPSLVYWQQGQWATTCETEQIINKGNYVLKVLLSGVKNIQSLQLSEIAKFKVLNSTFHLSKSSEVTSENVLKV